jgi:ubiquinone/menaquinone biosynthesis C-methylase UbiE
VERSLEDFWACYLEPSGQLDSNYWEYFAERLAQLATIPTRATLLDIGTCDGNVLFKAMKKIKAQGYGIGIDIAYDDFYAGVNEAMQRGWEKKVAFVQMNGNTLGFRSETFHTVLANFVGWDDCFDFDRMEFIAPDRKLAEIWRVLKPGGQVGIGFWIDQIDINWIVEEFKKYLPTCRKVFGDRIIAYGQENIEGYEAVLRSSGFRNISVQVEKSTFVSSNMANWWRQMKITASDYFKKMPELDRFKEQIFTDLEQCQSPKGIHFVKTVGYAFGTKL